MANPAFHHWAVLVKCNNRDGVKKEAVFEGLKEDGKVIKNSLSSQLDCRNGWKFRQVRINEIEYHSHREIAKIRQRNRPSNFSHTILSYSLLTFIFFLTG